MLHFDQQWPASERELYLQRLPTSEDVDDLFDREHRWDWISLRRNPYSDAPFFIRISWTATALGAGSVLLTTSAELVNDVYQPLTPRHIAEPRTTVLLTPAGVFLMGDSLTE
jgi:hypothetical protein